MAAFFTFWEGPVTKYELLCFLSHIRRGHSLKVFSNEKLRLPNEIQQFAASSILKDSSKLNLVTPAQKADLFRFQALKQLDGEIWVDSDVLCLTEGPFEEEIIFAREYDTFVIGTLKFPGKHPLLDYVIEKQKILMTSLETLRWSALGTDVFDAAVRKFELESRALQSRQVYPIGYNEVNFLIDPRLHEAICDRTSNSLSIHLYYEILRRTKFPRSLLPPKGSFLFEEFKNLDFNVSTESIMNQKEFMAWNRRFMLEIGVITLKRVLKILKSNKSF